MTSITRPAAADPSASSTDSSLGPAAYRDEVEIAKRRMRHLAPWHVQPMPMTHVAASAPAAGAVSAAAKERRKRLALHVLAVQMGYARATSALS